MLKFMLNGIAAILITLPITSLAKTDIPAEEDRTSLTDSAKEVKSANTGHYVPPAGFIVPDSSKEVPADAGVRGHTNILIRKIDRNPPKPPSTQPPDVKP